MASYKEVWYDFKDEMKDLSSFIKKCLKNDLFALKRLLKSIIRWVGYDGLLNLETCTVLVCFLGIILPEIAAALLVLFISVLKSAHDKYYENHDGELHDFICCIVGIILGMLFIYLN